MTYRLLALDIDGTLLGPDQTLSQATLDAVARGDRSGLKICIATGRSLAEAEGVWRQLQLSRPCQPIVITGGALVSDAETSQTLYQRTIPWPEAQEFAQALADRGFCAMALVDSWRHELDYIVTEQGDTHAAQRDWFSKMDVKIRYVRSLSDSHHLPPALRISSVVDSSIAQALATELAAEFDQRLNIHAIHAPNYNATIIEAFAAGVSKFEAITYIAQAHTISASQIAAVGDDVNDLSMIKGAGFGAAMPNACETLAKFADHNIKTSLADFINALIEGEFDK